MLCFLLVLFRGCHRTLASLISKDSASWSSCLSGQVGQMHMTPYSSLLGGTKNGVLIGTNWKGSLERVMHQNMYVYWSMYFFTGSKSSHGFVVLQSRVPFWECILSRYVHWILWLSLYSLQPLDLETKTLSVSGCFNGPIKVRLVSGLKAWQESCKRHDKVKNVLVKYPCFKCLINQCQDLES